MSRESPDGSVKRASIHPPVGTRKIGHGDEYAEFSLYRCDACDDDILEPYAVNGRLQLCDSCCRQIAELWNHEHSGSWILHNTSEPEPRPEYVYLAKADTGEYKIGWSTEPNRRVPGFDAKMPIEVELIHHFEAYRAVKAESTLHKWLSSRQVKGEWFDLSDRMVFWLSEITSYEDGTFYCGETDSTSKLERVLTGQVQ